MLRVLIGFIFFLSFFSSLQSQTEPTLDPTQIELELALERLAYLDDVDVMKLGVKQIRRLMIGTPELPPLDLSNNMALAEILMTILESDRETMPGVGDYIRLEAARLLGEADLMIQVHERLVLLIQKPTELQVVEAATLAMAQKWHRLPDTALISAHLATERLSFLTELAILVPEDSLVAYIIDRALADRALDRLYGIDHPEAAHHAVADFRSQFEVPASPDGLTAQTYEENTVLLIWQDQSLNELGFVVERSEDGQNFSRIVDLPSNQISYIDRALTPGLTFTYRMVAKNTVGFSPPSAAVTYTVPLPPPPPPENPEPETEPQPDPLPESPQEPSDPRRDLPVIPPSPPARTSFQVLAPKLRIWIGGEPSEEAIRVLVEVIEGGHARVSIGASENLGAHLTRAAFDFNPVITSLSLRAIKAINRRRTRDGTDYSIEATERRDFPIRLQAVMSKLEREFEVN